MKLAGKWAGMGRSREARKFGSMADHGREEWLRQRRNLRGIGREGEKSGENSGSWRWALGGLVKSGNRGEFSRGWECRRRKEEGLRGDRKLGGEAASGVGFTEIRREMGRLVEVGREGERGVELQGEEILEENSTGRGRWRGLAADGGGRWRGCGRPRRRWAGGGIRERKVLEKVEVMVVAVLYSCDGGARAAAAAQRRRRRR